MPPRPDGTDGRCRGSRGRRPAGDLDASRRARTEVAQARPSTETSRQIPECCARDSRPRADRSSCDGRPVGDRRKVGALALLARLRRVATVGLVRRLHAGSRGVRHERSLRLRPASFFVTHAPEARAVISRRFRTSAFAALRCRLRRRKPRVSRAFRGGRYWARTSDPQLVELVLSQLS